MASSVPSSFVKDDAVEGVIYEAQFRFLKVAAFLRDRVVVQSGWELFGKYTPAEFSEENKQFASPPILTPLEMGNAVYVKAGHVIPLDGGKRGLQRVESVIYANSHFHFLGFVRGGVSSRWALLEHMKEGMYLVPFKSEAIERGPPTVLDHAYSAARSKAELACQSLFKLSTKSIACEAFHPHYLLCHL